MSGMVFVRMVVNVRDGRSPGFKKTNQKILSFDEVMACQSSPFFGPLKNELKFSRGI